MNWMKKQVKGNKHLEKYAIPNYYMGCKRVLLTNNWFKSLI